MTGLHFQYHFGEFLGVVFTHSYYMDMKCKDLQIVPTAETANLLRNYQLIFKENIGGDGFKIAFLKNEETQSSLNVLNKMNAKVLRFKISVKNKSFQNFTDIALSWDKILFITNKNEKSKSKNAGEYELLEEKQQLNRLDIYRLNQTIRTNKEVKLKDDKGKITLLSGPQAGLTASTLSQGRYEIETDKNKTELYYLSEAIDDWGVLEIDLELLKNQYSQRKEAEKAIEYKIPFQSRTTYWNYIIANYGDTVYDDYIVECETDKKITFLRTEDYLHSSGKACHSYISSTPIPIRQKHKDAFVLKLVKKGKNNIKNIRLSVASDKEIIPVKGKGYKSVIFVNVYSPQIGENQ